MKKEMPLISVVVPVYNVEKYIRKCVDSIIAQTYSNIEIILVDDGSPDNCTNICDDYALNDKRIKVIHKKNGGLSDARNAGIEISSGKYITFIDSDDYVNPEYVEYMYNILVKNNAQISICDFEYISENGNKFKNCKNDGLIFSMERRDALKELCKGKLFTDSAWGKLYFKELFENIRYPVGYIFEDIPTTYKLFFKCERIVYGRMTQYSYLFRNDAISKKKFSEKRLDAVRFTKQMCSDIEKNYPELKEICANKLFSECVYAFKSWSNDKNASVEHYKYLKTVMKESKKNVDKGQLSAKMKLYYYISFFGRNIMTAFAVFERNVSLNHSKGDKR